MMLPSAVVVLFSVLPVVWSSRDRSGLIFNYLSPVALGISSCSVILLVIAVVASCYFDNKGQSGLPKSVQQFPPRIWVPRAKQIRDEVEHQMSREPGSKSSKSDEEPATAIQIGDIEEEARHFPSVQRHVSSRMDPTEKHNRIIEAIYQASGRDLPEEYKTQGGAANVHGIRSRELKNAPLEVIKEADETAATQRTLTEKTEKKPQKSTEKGCKKNEGELTEDKTMSVDEPKDETKKQADEKKAVDEKKALQTAVETKKDGEEKKTETTAEKKEDVTKKSSKDQILTMDEIKEDQKKVEEKKKEEKEKQEEKKVEKQEEKVEKTDTEKTETEKTEKSEKSEDTSTKATAKEATPKNDDKKPTSQQ